MEGDRVEMIGQTILGSLKRTGKYDDTRGHLQGQSGQQRTQTAETDARLGDKQQRFLDQRFYTLSFFPSFLNSFHQNSIGCRSIKFYYTGSIIEVDRGLRTVLTRQLMSQGHLGVNDWCETSSLREERMREVVNPSYYIIVEQQFLGLAA